MRKTCVWDYDLAWMLAEDGQEHLYIADLGLMAIDDQWPRLTLGQVADMWGVVMGPADDSPYVDLGPIPLGDGEH